MYVYTLYVLRITYSNKLKTFWKKFYFQMIFMKKLDGQKFFFFLENFVIYYYIFGKIIFEYPVFFFCGRNANRENLIQPKNANIYIII